jgi:hypothetical protein
MINFLNKTNDQIYKKNQQQLEMEASQEDVLIIQLHTLSGTLC